MEYFWLNYKDRLITGSIIFVSIFIIGLINNYTLIWLMLGVIYIIAFHEAMLLFELKFMQLYIIAGLVWLVTYFYPHPDDILFIIIMAFGGYIAYSQKYIDKKLLLPFLYPVGGFLFIFSLYSNESFGILYLLWLLVIVSSTDIAAFLGGKILGRRTFSKTSPNKTWEGVISGVIVGTILGIIISLITIDNLSFMLSFFISLIVSIFSVIGDLFESYLKREIGAKDSGNILPGHGGVLDRIDGYLFGAPIMLISLRIFV